MRLPSASLHLLSLLLLSSAFLLVAGDSCWDCCNDGYNCGSAFGGYPGQCCVQQSNTVYCCPAGDVCAQDYSDALCLYSNSGSFATYPYAYTHSSGVAGWLIAIIVVACVCCCVVAAGVAFQRRRSQRNMMENGGGPQGMTYGNGPVGYGAALPPTMQGGYAQPAMAAPYGPPPPMGVMAGPPPFYSQQQYANPNNSYPGAPNYVNV